MVTVEAQGDALPINLGLRSELYANLEQIQIVACGTSWHAGGNTCWNNWRDSLVHASNFAMHLLTANTLVIGVTQSGADTLAALTMEKQRVRSAASVSATTTGHYQSN